MSSLGAFPYAVAIWIFCCGLHGVATSKNLVHLVTSVAVLQTSTYVLLLAVGYRTGAMAPIFIETPPHEAVVDPIVQALMLTDVVVEATVMALLLALVANAHERSGTLDPDELNPLKG